MTNTKSTVGILGAGISGLSAAYALRKSGIPTTLYEQAETVGGVIQSQITDGWLTELGPNTLMVRTSVIWDLISDLDLDGPFLQADQTASKRFILKNNRLMALPSSLKEFLGTRLISGKAKLRLLKEPFISAQENKEESISDFVQRRLGKEVLDYTVNPFVAGIFAGDPKKLSLQHTFTKLHDLEQNHGSIFKGILKSSTKNTESSKKGLISFKNGLKTLPFAIHQKIDDVVKLNHKLINLTYENGQWQLKFENGAEASHDVIMVTTPTYTWPDFLKADHTSEQLDQLAHIPYAPMAVVHLGYKKEKINHPLNGFGMLIPESEQRDLLGTLFSSSLFPGRAPDGYDLLTSFIGGARKPEMAGLPAQELSNITHSELKQILGISGTPDFISCHRWKRAIPQYETGYTQYLNMMNQLEDKLPGFYLCGSFRNGVSVPDCIQNAVKKAEQIISKY